MLISLTLHFILTFADCDRSELNGVVFPSKEKESWILTAALNAARWLQKLGVDVFRDYCFPRWSWAFVCCLACVKRSANRFQSLSAQVYSTTKQYSQTCWGTEPRRKLPLKFISFSLLWKWDVPSTWRFSCVRYTLRFVRLWKRQYPLVVGFVRAPATAVKVSWNNSASRGQSPLAAKSIPKWHRHLCALARIQRVEVMTKGLCLL